jgi:translocation and assembly module TamB
MRRRLLIGALTAVGLTLIFVASLFIYIRSGRLDRFLEAKIVEALAEVGVRAEIERAHLELRPYKVRLDGVKLYTETGSAPFGVIGSIEAEFSVLDYLKQNISITQVKIVDPHFVVKVDENGRWDLQSLHSPPASSGSKGGDVRLSSVHFEIDNGEVSLDDRSRRVTLDIPGISVSYTPRHPDSIEDSLDGLVEAAFDKGTGSYQGRTVENIGSRAKAVVTADGADLSDLSITSSLGQASLNGHISSFQPFKYDLKLKSNVSIERISDLIDRRVRVTGLAAIEGAVEGTDANYHVVADLTSGSIAADGIRVNGLKISTNVQGNSSAYRATADLQSAGAQSAEAQVGRTDVKLTVTGSGMRPSAAGSLTLASVQSGNVTVSDLKGRLDANRERVALSDLTASVLGGSVSGSALVAFSRGESKVDLTFKSIDLEQAAQLAPPKDIRITGSTDGTAALSFPGLDYKAATGRLDLTFDAAVSRPGAEAKGTPTSGQVGVALTATTLTIEKALVHSAQSDLTATGTIDRGAGAASLTANFSSRDMLEVQQAIDALGLVPDAVSDKYHIQLAGPGTFSGQIAGTLSAPTLTGHVNLSEIKSGDDNVGSLQGDIQFSQQLLSIASGVLVRPDGTSAQFSLNAPLDGADNISAKATLTKFDLAALAKIASPGMEDFVGRGTITGSVELAGLPGPRTIRGSANVSVTGAEFNIPPLLEGKEEPTKMSVPEFAGEVTFENSVLSVQNLQAQIGDSHFDGQFTFNVDTYAYAANVQGRNVDLANVAGALSDTAGLAGTADLVVKGQGDWDDWSTISLNAIIQGHGVSYAGRDFGDAKLAAFTDNGLLKVDVSGNLLNTPRMIEAVVDLRDKKNYPVTASIDFADTEIGPYLGLLSPQLSGISGKATGSIRLGGPLQDPDQVHAEARLTKLELGGAVTAGRRYVIANQGDIVLRATPAELTLDPVTLTGEGTRIELGGTVSREGGGKSNLTIGGTINLQLISSLSQVMYTTGIAEVQASIVGSLNAPRLTGSANLKDVGVQIVDLPFSISHGKGEIRFTEYQAAIEHFTATTPGGGDLTISGGASLAGLVPDRWRIELAADQVGVEYPRDTQTIFGGTLVFQGNRQLQVFSGDLTVRRAAYTKDLSMAELISNGGPFGSQFVETGPGNGGGPGPRITVDIKINADNTLVIRNNIADVIGSAHLQLTGPLSDPDVVGKLAFTRGNIEFLNDRYELTRWLITFPGTRGSEPYIDLLADTDISGYRVTIALSGPFSKLRTTPSSDPPLSENDLVALILTGRPALDNTQALTNYAAGQTGLGLAQTLLSATLSEQIQHQTQRIFGLNRFSIDPLIAGQGADPTARVTVGQRITKDFTVTYSQNLTAGPEGLERVALVEYRLTNKFSIVGIRDETGSIGFNIRIRKRF